MSVTSRHHPFHSSYRPDFEVVEERHGRVSLFPHTEQLPRLHRALELEFKTGLPGYLARVDRRGDGYHKHLLRQAAMMFCSCFNGARPDGIRLMALADRDLVTRLTVVQQIAEDRREGRVHRFKFYGGPDFFEEIRLSGRQMVFADHVLERFSQRVTVPLGNDLSWLFLVVFGTPYISLPVGPHYAFVLPYLESLLVFPFVLDEAEFLFKSCLTLNEIHSIAPHLPAPAFNLHYGTEFAVPRLRHWHPTGQMYKLIKKWEQKVVAQPNTAALPEKLSWHRLASWIKDLEDKNGHGPGTRFFFWDHIPGPCVFSIKPNEPEPLQDERQFYRDHFPDRDWEQVFAEQEATTLHPPLTPPPARAGG